MDVTPTCNVEDEPVISSFCRFLEKFMYDEAKELLSKELEKDGLSFGSSKSLQGTNSFQHLISVLHSLQQAERHYVSLQFLGQKRLFGRKEAVLRQQYQNLQGKLEKLADNFNDTGNPARDVLLATLSHQFGEFCTARCKMSDLYERASTMAQKTTCSFYRDLLNEVCRVKEACSGNFVHSILLPLRNVFSTECDLYISLLRAYTELTECRFLPCLTLIWRAYDYLLSWSQCALHKEGNLRFGSLFGSSSKSTTHSIYHWFNSLWHGLVARFSLYFQDVIGCSVDVRALQSKCQADCHSRITIFVKKSVPNYLAIVERNVGRSSPLHKLGYLYPSHEKILKDVKAPSPFVLYCTDRQKLAPPDMLRSLLEAEKEAETPDTPTKMVVDGKFFYSLHIEAGLWIIAEFDNNRKLSRDGQAVSLLLDIVLSLRGNKLFAAIRPNFK